MLNEFKQYLLGIGKSENTALNYCDKVKLYFKWCLDSFGSEPQQLYGPQLGGEPCLQCCVLHSGT